MSSTSATRVAAVHTHGLTKRFGATLAVDHLDLDVRPGSVFGFLGPNGAGKVVTGRTARLDRHPHSAAGSGARWRWSRSVWSSV